MINIRDTRTNGDTCLMIGPLRFGIGIVKYDAIALRGFKPFYKAIHFC